jgi:acetate kinase
LALGTVEKIGLSEGLLTHKTKEDKKYKFTEVIPNHETGINLILKALVSRAHGVIGDVLEMYWK